MKKNYLILDYVNFVGLLTKIYDIKYQYNYSIKTIYNIKTIIVF